MEVAIESLMMPHAEPTPAIPFHTPKLIGQQLSDVILRRHLEKFSCSIEITLPHTRIVQHRIPDALVI
ncbi:uncharacterized protein F5147DRAFT_680073 [Suillus discolor]|uniref:Uncharacterized protein n=1 Tax=Suillus discolor TaxID=1912936 RepID=A0A9P7FE76_9AGAM|nr:uncharacterized protein F5147DRAFT_680073 [Suillus discolor]KAG2113851.1 hypothetical protein F5147DRAFT_680073 [Suillus discolor]